MDTVASHRGGSGAACKCSRSGGDGGADGGGSGGCGGGRRRGRRNLTV